MKSSKGTRRPGRPLSFDHDEVLVKAMYQFWKTGYETTSVADLTRAMGITTPSLYTAFGDKESLFLKCLRRYSTPGPQSTPEIIRESPSAKEAARALLEGSARWFTTPGFPAGCLIASAASSGSENSVRVRAALTEIRHGIQDALLKRTERDMELGRLPPSTNAASLAAMTTALIQGMSTLARDGASQTELLAVVEVAIAAWPIG